MKLPDLLPKELHFVGVAETDEALFKLLSQEDALLTDFFVNACEDETWCLNHAPFFRTTLNWVMEKYFSGRLNHLFAVRVVRALQTHFRGIEEIIPKNLDVIVENQAHPMNRLMAAIACDTLFQQETLNWKVPAPHFLLYKQFIEMNAADLLWRYDLKELLEINEEAKGLGLAGFDHLTAGSMKRYLNGENVVELLIFAHDTLWDRLKHHCIDVINHLGWGVALKKLAPEQLGFEFLAFTPEALHLFDTLKSRITHLVCTHTEEPQFEAALQKCPNLVALDISHSLKPCTAPLPSHLRELNLSYCGWLNEEAIKPLSELRIMRLRGNTHLSFTFWQALYQFPALEALDLSHCLQLGDEELQIVGIAVPHLQELNVQECAQIGDMGFAALARQCKGLLRLDASRTKIGDGALIEFAVSCPQLMELRLVRCPQLTERGISEARRLATHLMKLQR
jgi:hypothetical protein